MDLGGAQRSRSPSAASPGDPQGELPRRGKRGWPGPLGTFPSLGKYLAPQGKTLLAPLQEYRAEKERRGHTPGWLLSAFGGFFTFSPRSTWFF